MELIKTLTRWIFNSEERRYVMPKLLPYGKQICNWKWSPLVDVAGGLDSVAYCIGVGLRE